jgi:protein-tyrosine kinase
MAAEPTGLIERAAALLRQQEAGQPGATLAQAPRPAATVSPRPAVTLDIGQLAQHGIPLPSTERSRVVEEFRIIKRNLIGVWSRGHASGERPAGRSIMVTSARPGEGKTFVALNLALAFAAETDGEAWLVDADSNHPLLESFFGYRPEAGFVDVLDGRLELSGVVVRTSHPKLSIIPAGRGIPQAPELLASKRMPALLADMTEGHRARIIIIDTPPCLLNSDASTLAPLVGQIAFVVEAHRTQQQEIETGLGLLGGCHHIGLILNKSDSMADEHFGSQSHYYYTDRKGNETAAAEPSQL